MAFGGFSPNAARQPVAEINMIPLIDVMLVLLVIFIIAAPLMTHAVRVALPVASSSPETAEPETVRLSLDAAGRVHWNDRPVEMAEWRARMAEAAARPRPPELRLRADGEVAYRRVAELMSDAARAGLTRIGFVTLPE